MTLKISFSKVCRENMKRYLAVGSCLLFVCLMQILAFVIEIQNRLIDYQSITSRVEMLEMLQYAIEPSEIEFGAALVFGVAFAYAGFGFLHSKIQSDFYGALPVKRRTVYQMNGFNSLLIFFVPVLVLALGKGIVLGVVGYLTHSFVMLISKGIVYQMLVFLASWVTAVLVIALTGQWYVGLLAYGVVAVYMPLVIRNLIPTYSGKFFHTFSYAYEWENAFVYNCFSPVSLSFGLLSGTETGKYLVGIILWIGIVGIISYLLFQRRPAEAAGRAMTFEKFNPVIRFLIVIPMALYAGWFLSETSMQNSMIWHVIGIMIGVFLFHGLIETIFQSSIRAVFAHKKQLAATFLFSFGITAVFYFDLIGYDKWIPAKESVKSIEVTLDNMENRQDCFWGEKPDGVSDESVETILALVRDAVVTEDTENAVVYSNAVGAGALARDVSTVEVDYDENDEEHMIITMETAYHMKNGQVKRRKYQIDENKSMELLNQLYADEDFKDDYFSLYTADISKISRIEWDNIVEYETVKLSSQEKEEFIEIYRKELDALSYSEIRNSIPHSEFYVTCSEGFNPYWNENVGNMKDRYYIYPSFEKTIAYLEEHGVGVKAISDYEIREVRVTDYSKDYEESKTNVIEDPDIIARYKDQFVYTEIGGICMNSLSSNYSLEATCQTPVGDKTLYFWVDDATAEKMMLE